jgi:hypothetical protein
MLEPIAGGASNPCGLAMLASTNILEHGSNECLATPQVIPRRECHHPTALRHCGIIREMTRNRRFGWLDLDG